MAFTHGMNVEEIRNQATEVGNISNDTSTSRGDANDMMHEFVESDWWGDDATAYLDNWMGTVDPAYQAVTDHLDEIQTDLGTQAGEQEDTSAR